MRQTLANIRISPKSYDGWMPESVRAWKIYAQTVLAWQISQSPTALWKARVAYDNFRRTFQKG